MLNFNAYATQVSLLGVCVCVGLRVHVCVCLSVALFLRVGKLTHRNECTCSFKARHSRLLLVGALE